MVGMIDTLTRTRIEGPATRHQRACRAPQRIEHWFFQPLRPDVRRERPAADRHFDAARRVVRRDVDRQGDPLRAALPVLVALLRFSDQRRQDDRQWNRRDGQRATSWPAHGYSR